jgi:hypothetical protein
MRACGECKKTQMIRLQCCNHVPMMCLPNKSSLSFHMTSYMFVCIVQVAPMPRMSSLCTTIGARPLGGLPVCLATWCWCLQRRTRWCPIRAKCSVSVSAPHGPPLDANATGPPQGINTGFVVRSGPLCRCPSPSHVPSLEPRCEMPLARRWTFAQWSVRCARGFARWLVHRVCVRSAAADLACLWWWIQVGACMCELWDTKRVMWEDTSLSEIVPWWESASCRMSAPLLGSWVLLQKHNLGLHSNAMACALGLVYAVSLP